MPHPTRHRETEIKAVMDLILNYRHIFLCCITSGCWLFSTVLKDVLKVDFFFRCCHVEILQDSPVVVVGLPPGSSVKPGWSNGSDECRSERTNFAALVGWSVLINPAPQSINVCQASGVSGAAHNRSRRPSPLTRFERARSVVCWSGSSVPSPDHRKRLRKDSLIVGFSRKVS